VGPGQVADSYGGYRARLVETLRANGIRDLAVLRAFGLVPRHRFVPEALRLRAYEDTALPIGGGQTISQPTTQARYLEAVALTGRERVLEVGTGSGYQTALLAYLASGVVSVERLPALAVQARRSLQAAGIHGPTIVVGDGSLGWRPLAPFDAIVVSAASPDVPRPLLEQLEDGGRLVIPLQQGTSQELRRITRHGRGFAEERLGGARFVPLIGRHGFQDCGG
jgi:protein-L-isoaspartate(D-aspartate) O-methyltransferase